MLQTTFEYIITHPFVLPIPKCHDPQKGYWLVKCAAIGMDDDAIEYRCVCENWLNYTFTLPVPNQMATLYESVYLSITQAIIQQRLAFLCSIQ